MARVGVANSRRQAGEAWVSSCSEASVQGWRLRRSSKGVTSRETMCEGGGKGRAASSAPAGQGKETCSTLLQIKPMPVSQSCLSSCPRLHKPDRRDPPPRLPRIVAYLRFPLQALILYFPGGSAQTRSWARSLPQAASQWGTDDVIVQITSPYLEPTQSASHHRAAEGCLPSRTCPSRSVCKS